MKFTYNWLKEFVATPLSPSDIAERLPLIGFELESFQSTLPDIDGVLIGKVLTCQPLPKSDHLKRCVVDIGEATLEVVCGAPNVATEQLVAVAPIGTTLPGGLRIEQRSIMGVTSQGMICSENELGLSEEADKIIVLEEKFKPGRYFREILEADWVYDIDVTPNRPDALGVIGIAREVGLLTNTPLLARRIRLSEQGEPIAQLAAVHIDDPAGCPRYAARLLTGITVGPSPRWMRKRLQAVGIRAISNLVDVTNYVMMETGQPLHAFDFDRLQRRQIVVKRARRGERFQSLDEQTHELQESDLMICDGERAVALAGVMGGLNSEVADTTTNILIECAHFDPVTVRRTAKRLGIVSEAARRFERGVDPNGVPYALRRTTQLMHQTAGGLIARGELDEYPKKISPRRMSFRPKRAVQVLGCRITTAKMSKILLGLECKVTKGKDAWRVTVPTFRPDLIREIDLIEEVARLHGYDQIPTQTRLQIGIGTVGDDGEALIEKLRQVMVGLGFDEAVTFDLMSERRARRFMPATAAPVALKNPLNEELAVLRTSLYGTLLDSLVYNLNRKNQDVWLFEIGSRFWRDHEGTMNQHNCLAALMTGNTEPPSWVARSRELGIFDVRGVVQTLTSRLKIHKMQLVPQAKDSSYDSGWRLVVGDTVVGHAGEISSEHLQIYDIQQRVFGLELDLDTLRPHANLQKKFRELQRLPAVERDLAIVVDEAVPARQVTEAIRESAGSYLESLELFDLYTGKQIAAGKKSLAFALRFRAAGRTLTDAEVDQWQSNILRSLADSCQAELR